MIDVAVYGTNVATLVTIEGAEDRINQTPLYICRKTVDYVAKHSAGALESQDADGLRDVG